MKTLLAHKQTEEQKGANNYARYQFIMAMMNLDDKMISDILKKDGVFMGNLNYWQFLHWLRSQFIKVNKTMFHSKYKEAISLDYYPGAEVFEFFYANMDNIEGIDVFTNNENIESEFLKSRLKLNLKFVLLFEDGKIADIMVPRRINSIEFMRKVSKEN